MLPLTKSCPHEMGKVAANVMSSRKGNNSERASAARCSPSVCSLSFTDSSPASGGAFNSLRLAFGSPAPSTGSLLVRFISLHIKPALKGEVDFAKQKPEGLKKKVASLLPQPLSQTFGLPAPRKGEPYGERISPHTSASFFDAEIHRRSCVGEKSQTFSLFRR